jgi:lipoprotein-anchoring transpeptidase ErfK/SrfK
VENLQPWTQGCISMRNDHLNELYVAVGPGTPIIIQR